MATLSNKEFAWRLAVFCGTLLTVYATVILLAR
jgi:hypothetical protein